MGWPINERFICTACALCTTIHNPLVMCATRWGISFSFIYSNADRIWNKISTQNAFHLRFTRSSVHLFVNTMKQCEGLAQNSYPCMSKWRMNDFYENRIGQAVRLLSHTIRPILYVRNAFYTDVMFDVWWAIFSVHFKIFVADDLVTIQKYPLT